MFFIVQKEIRRGKRAGHVLRYEEYVDGTEIEVVEVGHCRHAFSAGMHASIKLRDCQSRSWLLRLSTHHDSLALVLKDVT